MMLIWFVWDLLFWVLMSLWVHGGPAANASAVSFCKILTWGPNMFEQLPTKALKHFDQADVARKEICKLEACHMNEASEPATASWICFRIAKGNNQSK